MEFKVRAFDEASQQVFGLAVEARDEAEARTQVAARGFAPLSIVAQRSPTRLGRRRRFDVQLFAQELHTLTQAGLSVVESLEALLEKEEHTVPRAVIGRLLTTLREGRKLSAAMQAQDTVFPALLIGIVQSAESTGELATALERYLAYDERVQAVRQRVVSASIYPAILLSVGALVAAFLMGWVVPRFSGVYRGAGRSLPWGSQLLLDWGQLVNQHGPAVLAGLLGTGALLSWWVQRRAGGRGWQPVLVWVPGLARWVHLMALARLYLTLGLLLRGGLPIQQALALVRSVLPVGMQPAVMAVAQQVVRGLPLSQALEQALLTTPVALRFVRAGERSGQLAEMLTRAALYHDAETTRWVDRFTRAFEPVLMAVIGIVIGGIVLLLYMPVFELAGSLQ